MKVLDIAIAGCGIAGLAAAILLRRQGHAVTVYERFESPRPLGSGLMIQPTGLAVLDALGLAEMVVAKGAGVSGLLGLNTEGERVLEAAYADLPIDNIFGLGIHRASLFETLFEKMIVAGAELRTGSEVVASEADANGRCLLLADGSRSAPHDLVVDALGIGSPLVPQVDAFLPFGALWATIDWPGGREFTPDLLEQRYQRADRMVGVLPTGQGKAAFFWSLRCDAYTTWRERGMAAFHDEVRALWPQCAAILPQLDHPDMLTFARYAHRTTKAPVGKCIVHLGDSWHAASPQLGQGANMALLDAWAFAKAVEESEALDIAMQSFLAIRQGHVRLYQWLTWAFTPPFQSASIWPAILRDHFMAPASRIAPGPKLKATLVSGLAGARLNDLGLTLPDYSALAAAASSASSRASVVSQS